MNRREYERVYLGIPAVVYCDGQEINAIIQNASEEGICLKLKSDSIKDCKLIDKSSNIAIQFTDTVDIGKKKKSNVIICKGNIRYTNDTGEYTFIGLRIRDKNFYYYMFFKKLYLIVE